MIFTLIIVYSDTIDPYLEFPLLSAVINYVADILRLFAKLVALNPLNYDFLFESSSSILI